MRSYCSEDDSRTFLQAETTVTEYARWIVNPTFWNLKIARSMTTPGVKVGSERNNSVTEARTTIRGQLHA